MAVLSSFGAITPGFACLRVAASRSNDREANHLAEGHAAAERSDHQHESHGITDTTRAHLYLREIVQFGNYSSRLLTLAAANQLSPQSAQRAKKKTRREAGSKNFTGGAAQVQDHRSTRRFHARGEKRRKFSLFTEISPVDIDSVRACRCAT